MSNFAFQILESYSNTKVVTLQNLWYNLIIGGDIMIDGLMFHDMEFKNIIVMKKSNVT